jgi:hypothetical protein
MAKTIAIVAAVFFISSLLWSQKEKSYVVFCSFDGKDTTEAYSINESRLLTLPECNPLQNVLPLSADSAIRIAERYIKRRYSENKFVFGSIGLSRFADRITYYPSGYAKDWVYIVSFEYNGKGHSQSVPILLDGSVVYSGNESFK